MKRTYTHPHPDPAHVMRCYRGHILGKKRAWSRKRRDIDGDARVPQRGARQLIHYRAFIDEYLAAKALVIHGRVG